MYLANPKKPQTVFKTAIHYLIGALVSFYFVFAGCNIHNQGSDPKLQCDNLVIIWCQKVESCDKQGYLECQHHILDIMDCKNAEGITGAYTKCLSDIQMVDCKGLDDTLPASCSNAIKFNVEHETPKSKCMGLMAAFCQRVDLCGMDTLYACQDKMTATLDCNHAIATTDSYDTCMIDVGRMPCDSYTLPQSCHDVIVYNKSSE